MIGKAELARWWLGSAFVNVEAVGAAKALDLV
jgi:hypothetical protein